MKKISLLSLFAYVLVMGTYADKPYWVTCTPTTINKTYDYKVTIGEAKTYDEAYAKALARAILETSWKLLGITVQINDDLKHIEKDVLNSLETITKTMRLPLNKVSEYSERPIGSRNIRLYILWQVPIDKDIPPVFENYNCDAK